MRQYCFLLFLLFAFDCLPIHAQTGKWTQLHPTNSPSARMGHGMAPIGDHKILLFGGLQENHYDSDETWIFDLSDNEWTKVDCEEHPRACEFPAFSKIDSNKVLLFGGSRTNDIYYDETWLFDLDSMKWIQLHPAKSPHSRNRGIGAYLGDGKVLVYGGIGCVWHNSWCDDFCSDTWIYDIKKNTWDSVAYCFPYGRELPQACELDNGRVFLYGGHTSNRNNPDHFIYDLDSMKWTFFYPKNGTYIRDASALVNLDGNIFLVFGGYTKGPDGPIPEIGPNGDTWLFNMTSKEWVELFPVIKPYDRVFHNIAKINKGKSILFGGATTGIFFKDTWLFELQDNSVFDYNINDELKVISNSNEFIEVLVPASNPYTTKITIYNIYGLEINPEEYYTSFPTPNNIRIDLSALYSGVYFLQADTDNRVNYLKINIAK
ncbi:MAG: kelch repeat-containing protein [Chloroflexota bacterium]